MLYLDYNATTPLSEAAKSAAIKAMDTAYGNPSSTHERGRQAAQTIAQARAQVAKTLNAEPDEVIFTSGGTEASNLAIKGVFYGAIKTISESHVITSVIEHPATTEPLRFLKTMGLEITVVGCDAQGVVSAKDIETALRPNTKLVSIMHANNEIGSVQPIEEIAHICNSRNILFHTDAAQSVGKIVVDFNGLGVDMMSVAGHKLYAPKGVGCLIVKRGTILRSVQHGAGHERGLRAGTENTVGIAALGAAMTEVQPHQEGPRLAALRDSLYQQLKSAIPDLTWNGAGALLLPNTLSVNFPGVIGTELLAACPEICASTGSACHSGDTQLSATLKAIGLKPETGRGTVRLSLGKGSKPENIKKAANQLSAAFFKLQGQT